MGGANPFVRQHTLIELLNNRFCVCRRREMDDVPQPLIRHCDERGINAPAHIVENAIESRQVDRLPADLDEVSATPLQPQNAAIDFADIIGKEPSIDLRIVESIVGDVTGKERCATKCQTAILVCARVEMRKQHIANGHCRRAFAHAIAGKNGPARCARTCLEIRLKRAASNENRAQARRRFDP